jgi:hypothetical protein
MTEKSSVFSDINRKKIPYISSMVGTLTNLLYTNKYKVIITSDMNNSYNYFRWRVMTVYHAFNIFNLGDRLRLDL